MPIELETVILTALAKAREERYRSAKALADDLERFIDGQQPSARRPSAIDLAGKSGAAASAAGDDGDLRWHLAERRIGRRCVAAGARAGAHVGSTRAGEKSAPKRRSRIFNGRSVISSKLAEQSIGWACGWRINCVEFRAPKSLGAIY